MESTYERPFIMEKYGFPVLSELPNYNALLKLPIQVYQLDDIVSVLISNTNLSPENLVVNLQDITTAWHIVNNCYPSTTDIIDLIRKRINSYNYSPAIMQMLIKYIEGYKHDSSN